MSSPSSMTKPGPAPQQSQAAFNAVLLKMGLFTLAMVVLPIGSYFVSRDYYFHDNLTGAGITAAMMANVVLVAFVVTALREDQQDQQSQELTKGQQVGATPAQQKKQQ